MSTEWTENGISIHKKLSPPPPKQEEQIIHNDEIHESHTQENFENDEMKNILKLI